MGSQRPKKWKLLVAFIIILIIVIFLLKDRIKKTEHKLVGNTPTSTYYICGPLRNINRADLGKTLSDIESHLPVGHIYADNDRITWSHEGNHGVSGNVRNQLKLNQYYNAFYLLDNWIIVLEEPKIKLSDVARTIPSEFRGSSYNLYLIQQQQYFQNEPYYLFDEWCCYTSGSFTRYELGITKRAETVKQMVDFMVYTTFMAKINPNREHEAFKKFFRWQIARTLWVYHKNLGVGDISDSKNLLRKFKNHDIFRFLQDYLGTEFTDKYFHTF